MTHSHPSPKDRRSGFALLITVTLLAFLVLLLVSLASLTRVETQIAANTQQHARARQNALMALNIALGQLQLTLGPDRRVSITASQKGDGVPDYGNQDVDNNANWVGVYRQNPDPTVTARDPQLLSWLVSGNHALTVPATGANTPTFGPNAVVSGLNAAMSAATPVTVNDRNGAAHPAVLLVGPGTVMAEPAASAPADVVDRFVVAPLENIQVPAGSLPGFDSTQTTPTTVGHFAYWVGDEGVKAKVSLTAPGASSTATSDEQAYRLRVAQRSGIELVESSTNVQLATNYPANAPELPKVLDLKQLPLANTAGQVALTNAVKNRYHDLTASSYSVLADVAQGGLKKDLTTWLANTAGLPASAPADTALMIQPEAPDSAGFGIPKWGVIRSYADFRHGVARPPQPQTDIQHGFGPVMTFFRVGIGASADEHDGAAVRTHLFPIAVLWNPYDTPIAAGQYEVAFGGPRYLGIHAFVRSVPLDPTPDANPGFMWPTPNKRVGRVLMNQALNTWQASSTVGVPPNTTDQTQRHYFRFLLDNPEGLLPGQSLVFTLDDTGLYTAGTPGKLPNRMSANSDYRKDNSVYFVNTTETTPNPFTLTLSEVWINPADPSMGRKKFWMQRQGEMELGLFPANLTPGARPTVAEMLATNPYQFASPVNTSKEGIQTVSPVPLAQMDDSHIGSWVTFQVQMSKDYFTQQRTPRWLVHTNPRAPYNLFPFKFPDNPDHELDIAPQVFMFSAENNTVNPSLPSLQFAGNQASAGESIDVSGSDPTVTAIAGFQPGPVDKPWKRFFSLAQLQHANVSLLAQNPAYAIGNSDASYVFSRSNDTKPSVESTSVKGRHETYKDGSPSPTGNPNDPSNNLYNPYNRLLRIYDLSYLLNKQLWDRYYFSTIPSQGGDKLTPEDLIDPSYRLPNPRHVVIDQAAATAAALITPAAFDTASSHLLVNGGFNVNSTSEQAWRALLAGHNNVDTVTGGLTHPYSRFATPLTGTPSSANGFAANTSWKSGYRVLSNDQIKTLARAIVSEVKLRGPFLSLADFINRRLRNDSTGYKGTLQAAIEASDADSTASNRINDRFPFNDYSTHRISTYLYSLGYNTAPPTPPYSTVLTEDFKKLMHGGSVSPDTPSASRAAYAPGFLTQADMLQSLGPVLSARSDTFVIRAYGDTQDPVTGTVGGRAWCEVTVQRHPDYMVPSTVPGGNAPHETPVANSQNDMFGRRFKIVSFRWLQASDI